jgi:sortase A
VTGRSGWGRAGVLLLGVIVLAVLATSVFVGTQLLSSPGEDRAQRAVEPSGAKQDPPKAVEETTEAKEPEKKEDAKDEAEKDSTEEQKKETDDQEQVKIAAAEPEPDPEDASASASASASAEASAAAAPADTTMSLSVPSIGLSTTVYETASESSLTAGTGHLGGTGYPWIPGSNTYVAGHRLGYPGTGSDHVFWDLPSVAIGDPVSLTDANGRTYDYAVSEILEVPITDLSVTEPVGSDVVSLQTCIEDYGDYWTAGPNWNVRYVVRATKV